MQSLGLVFVVLFSVRRVYGLHGLVAWRMGEVWRGFVGNVSRGLALLLFGRRHPRRYLLLSRPSRSLLRGTSGVQPRDSEQ